MYLKVGDDMIKKLLTILLCGVLGLSILSGCSLFVLDEDKDMAEPVAVIASKTVPIKVLQADGSLKADTFTSEEKVISKLQLANVYSQYGADYQKNYGFTVKETFESLLDQLVDRELLIIEAEKLLKTNQIRFKQSELNEIWKVVYDAIDNSIYTYEEDIAKEYEENIYIRGKGEDLQPLYPTLTYANPPEEDKDIEYDIDEDGTIADEEKWQPEGSRGPIFDYSIIEYGTDEAKQEYFESEDYRAAALKTEALRRFLESIRENLKADILAKADLAKYNADWAVIDSYKNTKPHKYAELYKKLQDFWFVKYIYYNDAYNSRLFTKLQEYVEEDISVSEEQVRDYYNKTLAQQKETFKDVNAYISAIKEGTQTILYHPNPVNAEWFYVKHILIPFSDNQKAHLESLKTQGRTDSYIKNERQRLADNITSYEHADGFDIGNPLPISQILSDINSQMSSLSGQDAERRFESLIFKYNTDPGIFNNVNGYGMQYTPKDLTASGYMPEFTQAAFDLYEQKVLGATKEAVTDYGVHVLMLSSIVEYGTRELGDYTSVFKDGLHDTTYQQALEKELLTKKKSEAFTNYQNQILKQLSREWEAQITLYEKRYKSLIKKVEG